MGSDTLMPGGTNPQSAALTPPVGAICGFWRRLGAFLLDWLILAAPLEVLGWLYFDRLARIGDWGAIVGIVVAVVYFGILGSSIGNGQTIGMRVGKIKVVDAEGKLLPVSKSLLRYTILWIPVALSGAAMPNPLPAVINVALFFIIYLYIFNRLTRQSLHDVAVGSFVVQAATAGQPIHQRMWKPQWVIASGCVVIGIVASVLFSTMIRVGPFPELFAIQRQIAASGKVRQVGVQAINSWSNGETSHYIVVTAIWNGRPIDYEKAAAELAAIALRADPNLVKRDALQISIHTGFNLGLATGSLSRSFSHSPSEWQQLVSPATSSQPPRKTAFANGNATEGNSVPAGL